MVSINKNIALAALVAVNMNFCGSVQAQSRDPEFREFLGGMMGIMQQAVEIERQKVEQQNSNKGKRNRPNFEAQPDAPLLSPPPLATGSSDPNWKRN